LQTNVVEVRTYSNYNQREKGFIGTNTVSFVTDIDRVSSLLSQSISVGATRIDRVIVILNRKHMKYRII
ncbi:MAG: SIMPL domain-containing protein, partial [Cyanobacteria bacterium J06600_6]